MTIDETILRHFKGWENYPYNVHRAHSDASLRFKMQPTEYHQMLLHEVHMIIGAHTWILYKQFVFLTLIVVTGIFLLIAIGLFSLYPSTAWAIVLLVLSSMAWCLLIIWWCIFTINDRPQII